MAKNTTLLLQNLRNVMKSPAHRLNAYIIPSEDSHMSEYIAKKDARRHFITGFDGSSGVAVITESAAALWTDGRYHLQAGSQIDDNWILMKDGLSQTPSKIDWLGKVLPENSRVGVDPWLISAASWSDNFNELKNLGHHLVPVSCNLIDEIWKDKPKPPSNAIQELDLKYTGETWQNKVKKCRIEMEKKQASLLVVTALDEIAYLLNLRGTDIQYNPVFFSYIILSHTNVYFYVDKNKLNNQVLRHLESEEIKIILRPYENIAKELKELTADSNVKTWISNQSNYALFAELHPEKMVVLPTPLNLMKAKKNLTEIKGMKNSHIKDAVALCQYLFWLEVQLKTTSVSEIKGAEVLERFRSEQEDYMGLSFDTISSSGSHGAIIHYKPTPETDRPITTNELYLCDSGAQYKDGTTDVTRTVHFGQPNAFEMEAFTRVLKGHISLAVVKFPNGVKGSRIDCIARLPLWEIGLDYLHGTGHGVGCFLNVHEGPCRIGFRIINDESALEENMVLSNEPGFYLDGKFGIRIESLQIVVKTDLKHNYNDKGFLTFEPITLVPIQRKLIDKALLTTDEINWINTYHEECLKIVGAEILKQNKNDLYDWLVRETKAI